MFRLTKRSAVAFGGALLLMVGGGIVAANAASAAGVIADCKKTQDWGSGFQGECTVTNGGSAALNGWKVEFDLSSGSIGSAWDANRANSGNRYTFTNLGWNGNVAPGSSVTFGFIGSGSPTISGCTFNGGSCAGGGDTTNPSVPGNLRSTGKTSTTVALAWDASTDASGISRYTIFANGAAKTAVFTGTTANVTGLTANTNYTFMVRAQDTKGNESGDSNKIDVKTNPADGGDTTKPTNPGGLTSTGKSTDSVSLSWTASTDQNGIAGYTVFVGGSAKTTVTGTSATVSGLAPDTNYSFTVRAKDPAGNESGDSNKVDVRTDKGDVGGGGGNLKLGYFVEWGANKSGRNYHVNNLVTSGTAQNITHINYAFANVTPGGECVMGDPWVAIEQAYQAGESVDGVADKWDDPVRGNFGQLIKLKKKFPHIKVIYSVGGWTWSKNFGKASQDPVKFANSCYNLVNDARWKGLFDGIDIDWEYPNACGDSCDTSGPQAYGTLMKGLRDKFGPSAIISSAITADGSAGGKIDATDYAGAAKHVNYYLQMHYDFFGAWAATGPTAPHSPLTSWNGIPQQGFTTADAVAKLKSKGVPSNKIAIGVGFYGRGWKGVTQSAPGGSATGAGVGKYEAGIQDYKELKTYCPATAEFAGTSYAHCGNEWWSYDTPTTIKKKMAWAKQQGLLGAFYWEFSGDATNGELAKAVKDGIG